MKIISFLCVIVLFLAGEKSGFSQTKDFDARKLESEFKQNIKKAYAASVRIANIDSNNNVVGGYFSGVVIDSKGHILTAAHAVKPNNRYLVSFSDGREVKAKGLGVIPAVDAAMMVITDKGKWPFAEMGWSSVMEPYMPCFSIAYPGSFISKTPTVRFGYFTSLIKVNGFLRNTCLMEPGDSGGPLFDFKGRVIGTHSRITADVTNNLECSIGNFRKYWTALKEPKVHTAFIPEDKVTVKDKPGYLTAVPEMKDMSAHVKSEDAAFQKTVFTIRDARNTNILGTLVDLKDVLSETDIKGKSFFVSKSSMVGVDPIVTLANGKNMGATVLKRDEEHDLVLLQIAQEIDGGVSLHRVFPAVSPDQLGTFMVSPRPKTQGEFSVLGNTKLKVLKSVPRFLGIEPSYRVSDYQMLVVGLHPINMEVKPCQEDILIKDDLLKINDRNILSVEDMPAELAKFAIGETVKIQYRRDGGEPRTKSIIIEPRYVQPNQKSDWFKEGRSQRRDNFNEVLVHDGKLSPAECGGPLYDTHGQFYGINIARTSRTSTFTIPASVVLDFVKDVKLK